MVTRRTFLKGLAAGAAALVLPPTLADNAEAARRFWALDSTMLSPETEWRMRGDFSMVVGPGWDPYTITVSDALTLRVGDLLRVDFHNGSAWVNSATEERAVITHIRADRTFWWR